MDFGGSFVPAELIVSPAFSLWVIAAGLTATTFRVSATRGGSALNLTTAYSGPVQVLYKNWTMDYTTGSFRIASNPTGLITCGTCWGLRGAVDATTVRYSPADIIEEVLTSSLTNTPFTSADIDAASFAAFKTLGGAGTKQVSYYLTEKTTFAELFDKLMLSAGGWWGFSRDGLLQLGRLDLPVAATPTYSFVADDVALRSMKLARRILPRAQIKLLADINWTVQSVFAGDVSQYDQGIYSKPGIEYLGVITPAAWYDYPTIHKNAAYPDVYQTYLTSGGFGQTEANRLAVMFQYPTAVFSFDTNQAIYLLTLGNLIYIAHPKFTGYGRVVAVTEKAKGRCSVEFFCQLPDVLPAADIA